jgi:hypothetical protein
MKTSESIANIAAALVQFQGEVSNPEKKGVNPHFKSKYAELDDIITTIRPALEKFGLAFIQNPVHDESGKVGAYTLLLHKSGEYIQFDPVLIPLQKSTPHQVGAALTYAKRYSLGAALGIATEEDKDGNDAMPKPQHSKPKSQQLKEQPKSRTERTEEEKKEAGIKAIENIAEEKGLQPDEYTMIILGETQGLGLKAVGLDKITEIYNQLKNNTVEDLKEIAKAHMIARKQATTVA